MISTNLSPESYIPSSRVVADEDGPILGIGSRDITQNDLETVKKFPELTGLLFYYPEFVDIDFSALEGSSIKKLSVMHGNFGDQHLQQIEKINQLRLIKLMDTKVSSEALNSFRSARPDIEVV